MVQFGKRAVFVLAAVALIGVAGTAAAATMVAAPHGGPVIYRQVAGGPQGESAPQPVAAPHHSCHWGMGDQGMKYQ